MVVERVRLEQVDDVEAISATGSRVRHSEVVPLSEAASVVVWLKNKIVFEFVNLNGAAQVS